MSKSPQSANGALACIPSGFGEIAPPSVPEGSGVPYVQFVSSKSKNYGELRDKIKDLREGEPVLIQPTPPNTNPIKLTPFRFFLLHASEYWAQYNQRGEQVAVSSTKPDEPNANPRWDQTIEAAILVILEDRLVPASVRFKTTKCPAVTKSMFAVSEAATAAWGRKGPEYKETMRSDQPWTRFTTYATCAEKTNRSTGTTYKTMEAQIHPSTLADFNLLTEFFSNLDNAKLSNAVAESYRKRLASAKSKERQLVAA